MAPSVCWIFSTTMPSPPRQQGKVSGSGLATEDGSFEGGTGAGASLALDDLDLASGAADLGPVGDHGR